MNDDTISRQAAIEDIRTMIPKDARLDIKWIEMWLMQLPSVQPEIIACADCKHWICHDRRCGYWNHGVKPLEWCCHAERRTDERLD